MTSVLPILVASKQTTPSEPLFNGAAVSATDSGLGTFKSLMSHYAPSNASPLNSASSKANFLQHGVSQNGLKEALLEFEGGSGSLNFPLQALSNKHAGVLPLEVPSDLELDVIPENALTLSIQPSDVNRITSHDLDLAGDGDDYIVPVLSSGVAGKPSTALIQQTGLSLDDTESGQASAMSSDYLSQSDAHTTTLRSTAIAGEHLEGDQAITVPVKLLAESASNHSSDMHALTPLPSQSGVTLSSQEATQIVEGARILGRGAANSVGVAPDTILPSDAITTPAAKASVEAFIEQTIKRTEGDVKPTDLKTNIESEQLKPVLLKAENISVKPNLFLKQLEETLPLNVDKPITTEADDTATSGLPRATQMPELAKSDAMRLQMPVTISFGKPEWAGQVAERAAMMSFQQIQSAELQLDPPELGALQVKVSVSNDQASVTFVSPHANVREALDQSASRLRELLEQQGIDLVDVNVSDQEQPAEDTPDEEPSSQAANEAEPTETSDAENKTLNAQYGVDFYA